MLYRIIIFLITIAITSFSALAKKKTNEYPQSDIKVSYLYHEKYLRGNIQLTEREIPMLLLANGEYSKFYSPTTEYKDSLESNYVKNLYITGELLDVEGICGGYNLQWAWATGYIAGNSASNLLEEK